MRRPSRCTSKDHGVHPASWRYCLCKWNILIWALLRTLQRLKSTELSIYSILILTYSSILYWTALYCSKNYWLFSIIIEIKIGQEYYLHLAVIYTMLNFVDRITISKNCLCRFCLILKIIYLSCRYLCKNNYNLQIYFFMSSYYDDQSIQSEFM